MALKTSAALHIHTDDRFFLSHKGDLQSLAMPFDGTLEWLDIPDKDIIFVRDPAEDVDIPAKKFFKFIPSHTYEAVRLCRDRTCQIVAYPRWLNMRNYIYA
jgi:hypothetical protein